MTRQTSVGWVEITSDDPPITLFVRLSDQRPNVTAGYGGWVEVARPRRRPLSVWTGSPALRMDLSLLIDRYRERDSIEQQIAQVEQLGQPVASDGAPPRLRVSAMGGGVPHQDRTWVVDTIAWGDPALVNTDGDRSRQQVTLSLLEYIRDVRVDEDSASLRKRLEAATPKTQPGAKKKRIAAKAAVVSAVSLSTRAAAPGLGSGEDLLSIAARELGDADRWIEIAQLNGIRDPRSITAGQVIRLP